MRIRVDYATTYDYAAPASDVVQRLCVQPAGHDAQHVIGWRIDTDTDGHLREHRDAFGNIVHMFYPAGAVRRLALHVSGEVDTADMAGVLTGTAEPLAAEVFLRTTDLTAPDAAIAAFARSLDAGEALATCHALNGAINAGFTFDPDVTHAHSDAADAFALQAGVCQDYAHVFLACARTLGIPARYVSGHLVRHDGLVTQPAGHAWAEAWVAGLGWAAFDPANGVCAGEAYLRVAVGLDYRDVAPVRGARRGGGVETMQVVVTTREAGQRQSQGQS